MILDSDEARSRPGCCVGLAQLLSAELGAGDLPDLAGPDELTECAEGVRDRRRRIRPVQVVQVNPVGAEIAEALVDGRPGVLRRRAGQNPWRRTRPELRGDDHRVPVRPERRTYQLLGR